MSSTKTCSAKDTEILVKNSDKRNFKCLCPACKYLSRVHARRLDGTRAVFIEEGDAATAAWTARHPHHDWVGAGRGARFEEPIEVVLALGRDVEVARVLRARALSSVLAIQGAHVALRAPRASALRHHLLDVITQTGGNWL